MGLPLWRECEFIVYATRGKFQRRTDKCLPGVFTFPVVAKKKIHVCSKPLELMVELMEVVKPGGTVLEPFLGGGTTLKAALKTGRAGVGIELSEEYMAMAKANILASDD